MNIEGVEIAALLLPELGMRIQLEPDCNIEDHHIWSRAFAGPTPGFILVSCFILFCFCFFFQYIFLSTDLLCQGKHLEIFFAKRYVLFLPGGLSNL